MNWIKTEDKNPELNEYVIVYTPFCKSKCSVAFFNGIEWRSTDDKTEVWNIEYWMPLPILPEKKIIQKILDFG